MPKPARSRQRPVPRPPAPTVDSLASGTVGEAVTPRTMAARPPRRTPSGGAAYAPPDYSYVGQDVIRILILSGVLVVLMVGLSKLLV